MSVQQQIEVQDYLPRYSRSIVFPFFLLAGPPLGGFVLWLTLVGHNLYQMDMPITLANIGMLIGFLSLWLPLSYLAGGLQAVVVGLVASVTANKNCVLHWAATILSASPVPIFINFRDHSPYEIWTAQSVHIVPAIICLWYYPRLMGKVR